ncbi:hypothetical protein Tco_0212977 [Tanacetum coccineum]
MAQQQQQIIPADQLVTSKYQSIGRCNNYVVLQNISCSPECTIVGQILIDHALSYALTATADVPAVYLQHFWKTVSKQRWNTFNNHEDRWRLHENLLIKKSSASSHVSTIFGDRVAVVSKQYHVDYIALRMKFPSIPQRIEEDYHFIKDDIPLVSVYTTGNVTVRGMLISDEFFTDDIRATKEYKEYIKVFVGAIHKNVDNVLHDIIPKIASNATNDIIEDNLPKVLVEAVMKERDTFQRNFSSTNTPSSADLQHQLYLKMKRSLQDQADDQELWEVLKQKSEKAKDIKKLKICKRLSSKQLAQRSKTYVSKQQQQQEWDTWVEEPVSDVDEVIHDDDSPELIEEFKNVYKHVPTIYDHEKMEATIVEVVRVTTEQQHGLDFLEQIIVMRENDKPDSFFEADFKYLNKNDIEDLYYLCRNKKVDYRENNYQIGVNLTAPTLTFLDIEACDPYSIVDKPSTGLIYLNVEIVKFCDAMLERVLNEVKLKIFEAEFLKKTPLLGVLDLNIMKAYVKEITKRLRHRMLLTRLFDHVMSKNPKLSNDRYVLYDRVMYPLTAQQERKTQKDYGTKRGRPSTFASSSSAFG